MQPGNASHESLTGDRPRPLAPNIGLSEHERTGSGELLNRLLADIVVLYIKTRNYHWNVTGPTFGSLHQLFETQYEELDVIMDETAERARMMGAYALGSMRQYERLERIHEEVDGVPDWQEMVRRLLADHETVIRNTRAAIDKAETDYHDAGTADYLTGVLEKHEKMAWMLRSYL